ncbi:MAG TPA: hypothetical protein VFQ42_22550 [Mycobacterium sp.]|nr:hypothetical protein [Mycobacterium sp.]
MIPTLDDISGALTVADLLAYAHIEVIDRGRGDLYGHQCPREYHRKSERAFTINRETGQWTCYACVGDDGGPLSGNKLQLLSEHERLTSPDDFPRVLAIAKQLSGIGDVNTDELARRRRDRQAAEAQRRADRAADQKRWHVLSIEHATQHWNTLDTDHQPGLDYLAERGVVDAVGRGLVRFDHTDRGSVAIPLYDDDGQIANVIRRRLPQHCKTPDDRFRPLSIQDGDRHRGLWARGSYGNPIGDVEPGRDVVLTEGFFDAITAALAFPQARVIGARSATDLAGIARAVAPLVKQHGTRLLIVCHEDDAGYHGALAACREAHAAGLRIGTGALAIVDCGASDLNDAWRAGWRPTTRSLT